MNKLFNTIYNAFSSLPIEIIAISASGIIIVLGIAYLISRRIFTVWHEALFMKRTNNNLIKRKENNGDVHPFVSDSLPYRIDRVWSVFMNDLKDNGSVDINEYINIGTISGKSAAYGRGGLYMALALLTGILSSVIIALSASSKKEYLLAALVLILTACVLIFFIALGKNAYLLLDEQLNAFCSLSKLKVFCVSKQSNYDLLKIAAQINNSLNKLISLLNDTPNAHQAVFTTKEMVSSLTNTKNNTDTAALSILVDKYCETMNNCLNGQLSKMGEIMQSTFDSQNAVRNAMVLLLNDIQATAHTLRKTNQEKQN